MTMHSRLNSPGHFAFDLSLLAYRSIQRSGFHMNLLKITLCHNKAFTILLHPPAQKTTLSSAHNKKASFGYDSIGWDDRTGSLLLTDIVGFSAVDCASFDKPQFLRDPPTASR